MKSIYNDIYSNSKEYKKHYKEVIYYPIWKHVLENVEHNDKILDLGCGPAHLSQMLFEGGVKKYTGIDYSPVAIKMARNRNLPYEYIESDLFDIDYSKYADHVIIATETFEHIENDIELIKMLPKNKIIFSVPNFMSETHERVYKNQQYIRNRYKDIIQIRTILEFKITEKSSIFACTGKIT